MLIGHILFLNSNSLHNVIILNLIFIEGIEDFCRITNL